MNLLLVNTGPYDNLQRMARGAFTTAEEVTTRKAINEDLYGRKKGICITALISVIALAIILGALVNPLAALVVFAVVIPMGFWYSYSSKHQDLENAHKTQYNIALGTIRKTQNYLKDRQNDRLTALVKNPEFPLDLSELKTLEQQFDKEQGFTQDFLNEILNAKETIKKHYAYGQDEPFIIQEFVETCSSIYGTDENTYKWVVHISNDKLRLETSIATYHPYPSVFQSNKTRFYSDPLINPKLQGICIDYDQ